MLCFARCFFALIDLIIDLFSVLVQWCDNHINLFFYVKSTLKQVYPT